MTPNSFKIFSAVLLTTFITSPLLAEDEPASDHRPVFSPDGGEIVFMSTRAGGDWELFLINGDGSGLQRLTDNSGWDGYAVWAPGGGVFIFDRETDGVKAAWRYDFATGEATPLIAMENTWPAVNSWSPDGETIALFIEKDKKRDLFLADADGTNLRPLTATPDQNEHDAHFSSDGTKLAFAVVMEDGSALDVMDLVSGEIKRYVTSTEYLYGLDWSPDGSKIVYTDTPNDNPDGNAELYMLDLASGETIRLTENEDYDHMPVWLPDGSGVMFSSYRSGREEIYILDLETMETKPFPTGLK